MIVKTAVIPAAGLGTRFLPNVKSMPMEMHAKIPVPISVFIKPESYQCGV